jgi:hypothetical protein
VARFEPFPKISNGMKTLNFPKFDRSKFDLSTLQKFEIKYSFEVLENMKSFLHRNFFSQLKIPKNF